MMFMGKSQQLYNEAKQMIPGGTQLLSKRPEMHLPDLWPAYYEKAKGCEVWDLDGNRYFGMSYMGVGSCILGYAAPDVNEAVKNVVDKGTMSTLNCPEEVELAELLCELHPWAKMVRYARSGGESMAIAIRIARAKTKKDIVLFCGYHGWHDWYLSANLSNDAALDGHLLQGLSPTGVPRALRGTSFPFQYNDQESFLSLIEKYKGSIAAVIMEPIRSVYPKDGFLEMIREITKKQEIVLIFDEITSGWRLGNGGAHLGFGLNPDIAVFAKGMSNGFPMAAIIGTDQVMEATQDTFISSTYWTERIGPTAAIAAIKKMKKYNVAGHLIKIGGKIQKGWKFLSDKHHLNIEISAMPSLCHFSLKGEDALVQKTLLTQLMLEKGFLATTSFYASYAHTENIIGAYLEALEEALAFLSKAVDQGNVQEHLKGPVCHSGFARLAS